MKIHNPFASTTSKAPAADPATIVKQRTEQAKAGYADSTVIFQGA